MFYSDGGSIINTNDIVYAEKRSFFNGDKWYPAIFIKFIDGSTLRFADNGNLDNLYRDMHFNNLTKLLCKRKEV